MDGVLEKVMKNNLKPDWLMLGNVATIYVNAGLVERARVALKNLENVNNVVRGREGFQTLITLYGRMNDPEGVYRAWEGLRATFEKPRNESYLIMLLALSRLKDVDGLEKWFTEWESNCTFYDVRLPNVMLESYLNRNRIDDANTLYERVIARGIKPNLRTVDLFMNYHLKDRKMGVALKFLEIGASSMSSESNTWFPDEKTVKMFLEMIDEVKDGENAEKFYGIMKRIGRFDSIQKLKED